MMEIKATILNDSSVKISSKDDTSFSLNLKDPSLYLLLFTNLSTVYFAFVENWNLLTVMWIYWFQSIIIGFFNFIRILDLRNYNFKAFLFAFHYGFFHFVYLTFLRSGIFGYTTISGYITERPTPEFNFILISAFLFFINHLFSYFYNKKRDQEYVYGKDVDKMMTGPYKRILPMQLTIVFGQMITSVFNLEARYVLALFLLLKIYADLYSHAVEHAPTSPA